MELTPDDVRDVLRVLDSNGLDELHLELAELITVARTVEAHYGSPQDIEWAVSRTAPPGKNMFLLQSRPETVWAEKDAIRDKGPVAAPTARAFDHVFNMLGAKRRPGG